MTAAHPLGHWIRTLSPGFWLRVWWAASAEAAGSEGQLVGMHRELLWSVDARLAEEADSRRLPFTNLAPKAPWALAPDAPSREPGPHYPIGLAGRDLLKIIDFPPGEIARFKQVGVCRSNKQESCAINCMK